MKKLAIFSLIAAAALASNYRIMPLSPEGLALSGANVAKSYSADAAIMNPANIAFLGARPQVLGFLSLYHIGGAKFSNELDNSLNSPRADAYANSSDAIGSDYNFGLGAVAAVLPLNERHYLSFALYTDMAAVYGWDTPYAKMLVDDFSIRSGTAAFSYAFKPLSDLSVAATLTVNKAKLKYSLEKTQAKNPRYFGNARACLADKSCSVADVLAHVYGWQSQKAAADYSNLSYTPHYVYSGGLEGYNDLPIGYKLSATYSPEWLDNKLNLSLVYNSKYNSDFKTHVRFDMGRWAVYDMLMNATYEYPEALKSFKLPPGADLATAILKPLLINLTDESPANRGHIEGPGDTTFDYPASIAAGLSYSYGRHDFLFNYAHTFWSKVNNLKMSLNYTPQLKNPVVDTSLLDVILGYVVQFPNRVEWNDTDLFSIGYRYNGDVWSFMAGFATEDTPLSRKEMTFMSKDARLYQFSAGAEYRKNERLSFEFGFAHQQYASVRVGHVDNVLIKSKGRFYGQSSQIASVGFKYIF